MPSALFLYPAARAAATLTNRADTRPVKVHVTRPRGTIYWGGAGLQGDYLEPTAQALQDAGIRHVFLGKTNSAKQWAHRIGLPIDAIRAGLVIRYEDDDDWTLANEMAPSAPQFNLIGYSYGSLLAAQTAMSYARKGHIVDNLVLIASLIDRDFLTHLQTHPCVRKVVVIDLKDRGDDLYAGISHLELVNPFLLKKLAATMVAGKGEGHFYYAHPVPDLDRRLKALAERIFAEGLR